MAREKNKKDKFVSCRTSSKDFKEIERLINLSGLTISELARVLIRLGITYQKEHSKKYGREQTLMLLINER